LRKTYRVLLGVGLAALVLLASCSQPGASSTPPSNADAQTITKNVMAAISAAFSASGASVKSVPGGKGVTSQTITTYPISFSNSYYSASGTVTINGTVTTANVTITFRGYSYNGVTFSSGTATIAYTADSSTNDFSFVYTGNFNITYNGTPYTFSWNLTANFTYPSTYAYTGTFTINGTTYTYTG